MIRLRDAVKILGVRRQTLYSAKYKAILEVERKIYSETMFTDESILKACKMLGIETDLSEYSFPNDIASIRGVAEMYGVHVSIVHNAIKNGDISATEKDGLLFVTREEYEKFGKLIDTDSFDKDDCITEVEVAEYLGVSYGTVKNMRSEGILTVMRNRGRVYYKRSEVEAIEDTVKNSNIARSTVSEYVDETTYSTSEVALLLGKSINTILGWAREGTLEAMSADVVGARGKRFDKGLVDNLVEMFTDTMSVDDVAECLGVSKANAYNIIRSGKIPLHSDIYGVRVLISSVSKYIKDEDKYKAFKTTTCTLN